MIRNGKEVNGEKKVKKITVSHLRQDFITWRRGELKVEIECVR